MCVCSVCVMWVYVCVCVWGVDVCDLETSRMGAPYIYDISRLRFNIHFRDKILCPVFLELFGRRYFRLV